MLGGVAVEVEPAAQPDVVAMASRLANPATWIGVAIAIAMTVQRSKLVVDGSMADEIITLAAEVLGVIGSWFFAAGMAPRVKRG